MTMQEGQGGLIMPVGDTPTAPKGFRKQKKMTQAQLEEQYGERINALVGQVNNLTAHLTQLTQVLQKQTEVVNILSRRQLGLKSRFDELLPVLEFRDLGIVRVLMDKGVLTQDEYNAEVEKVTMEFVQQRDTEEDSIRNLQVVDRPAQVGDVVVVKFKTEDGRVNNPWLQTSIGPNDFKFPALLPELASALVGMKAGENRQVKVSFPENYEIKEYAGNTDVFDLTLLKVKEKKEQDPKV